MRITSAYPVLLSSDVTAAAGFWRTHFDFETTFETDWYVSLRQQQWELGIVAADHETVPATHRRPTGALLVNLEVDDVDEQYRRLVLDGPLTAVLDLRSESFGQRHFILTAPDGVLVDVITPIELDAVYASAVATSTSSGNV